MILVDEREKTKVLVTTHKREKNKTMNQI